MGVNFSAVTAPNSSLCRRERQKSEGVKRLTASSKASPPFTFSPYHYGFLEKLHSLHDNHILDSPLSFNDTKIRSSHTTYEHFLPMIRYRKCKFPNTPAKNRTQLTPLLLLLHAIRCLVSSRKRKAEHGTKGPKKKYPEIQNGSNGVNTKPLVWTLLRFPNHQSLGAS